MARKLHKSLADYVVIAISPALIMLLVGSLVFFLLEVGYDGRYPGRLRWILFWFVLASVLIARIGIEQGRAYAAGYSLVLAVATAFVIMKYVDVVWLAWILLAVVWWFSDKLTWDCTLIDDSQDASGEGLLQAAGMEQTGESDENGETAEASADGDSDESVSEQPESVWPAFGSKSSKKPHTPGLWVVYFSCAAVPIFGVGQTLISSSEGESRAFAFWMLCIYVAAGMGLLLTTSFLGLRRYLRQRRLEMPGSVTGTWLTVGTGLILAVLLGGVLLPRPQASYSITGIIDKVSSLTQDASDHALLDEDGTEGSGAESQEASSDAKSGNAKSDDKSNQGGGQNSGSKSGQSDQGQRSRDSGKSQGEGQQSNDNARQNDNSRDSSSSKKQSESQGGRQSGKRNQQDRNRSEQNEQGGEASQQEGQSQNQSDSPGKSSPPMSFEFTVANWVKWLLYGLLALVGLYYLIRYWNEISDFLSRLWQEFLSLFGRRKDSDRKDADDEQQEEEERRPTFADYPNPFSTGAVNRMKDAELLRYSFEALEAWAGDHNIGRDPDQTPMEFAEILGGRVTPLEKLVNKTARMYARLAYAGRQPPQDCSRLLEQLWRRMGESAY